MADSDDISTPRWVKVFASIAVLVIAVFVILVVTGRGGEHGPGRHTPSSGGGGHTPPLGAHTQP